MEGDHAARLDRHQLAGARVAARTRCLGADLEVAETCDFDLLAFDQGLGDQLEEGIDDILRFALVETDLLEQQFRQLRLGQGIAALLFALWLDLPAVLARDVPKAQPVAGTSRSSATWPWWCRNR